MGGRNGAINASDVVSCRCQATLRRAAVPARRLD